MAAIVPRGHWSAPRPLPPVPSLLAVVFLIDLEITNVLDGRPETMQAREARPFVQGHTVAQCHVGLEPSSTPSEKNECLPRVLCENQYLPCVVLWDDLCHFLLRP